MELTKEQFEKDLRNNVFAYASWSLEFVDTLDVKEYLCLSPEDYSEKEIKEYLEAFDAKDEDPSAMKKIADLYSAYKALAVSLPFYETLLEKGDSSVCPKLIDIYVTIGEEEKLEKTIKMRLREESNPDAITYYKALLANRYENEKKYDEAFSIYISESNHFYSELGRAYLLGRGVKKDEKTAYLYFLKGSREKPNAYFGYNLVPIKVPSSYYLFKAYARGDYLPKDDKKALMYGDIFMRLTYRNNHYTILHDEVRYDPDYVTLKKDYLNTLVDKEETTDNLLDKLEVFSSKYFDEKEDANRIIDKLLADPEFNYLALFEDVALKGYYFGYFASSPYKHKKADIKGDRYIYKASLYLLHDLSKNPRPLEIVDKIIAKAKTDPGYLGDVSWPIHMDVNGALGKKRAKELYKTLLCLDYAAIHKDELDKEYGYEEQWFLDYLGVKE